MPNYLNDEITMLLSVGYVKLTSEDETVEVVQRLRKNAHDMSKVDFCLKDFYVTCEV
jgi:hypothetical protein